MKVSYKWLSSLLPQALSVNELSVILTSIGLEVDDITTTSTIPGDLKGLVIGKVITCTQHPNADKLSITTVDVGAPELLNIVCGAPNVAAGQTVVVATIGTTIYPKAGEPFEIKKAKIRGEASEGMICAEDEIGLGDSHAGIIILPNDIAAGTLASEYYNIPEADTCIEIGLTPNRMDAMSHIGIAKDVCAYLANKQNTFITQIIPAVHFTTATNVVENVTINIEATADCKRYAGVLLHNITVAESPAWLQEKLNTIGVRSINNIVDITNYILHETGQPLHAFDAAKVTGGTVIVKRATTGEKFLCLDDKTRTLTEHDLMICNATEPMCIAGVYGGATSGVTSDTKSIFLESAWFAPKTIRKTSMHHGLRTDAAIRFEKGVDVSQTRYALERAMSLMCELAGATVASAITDYYPEPLPSNTVTVTYAYINKLSGGNYSVAKIKNILLHLCFGIIAETDTQLTLQVPYSKPDISLPADIVEEIMRIDGLDEIPFTGKISFAISEAPENINKKNKERISNLLTANGYHELFTNSITNSAYYPDAPNLVRMMNSLSAELDIMRPSMLETGLQAIAFNINRKNTDLFLFEIGKIYAQYNDKYNEEEQLIIYLSGNATTASWHQKQQTVSIYNARAIAEVVLQNLGIAATFSATENGLDIKLKKQKLGSIYCATSDKLKTFDIKQAVWIVQFNWAVMVNATATNITKYTAVPKFQGVRRDLALVIDKAITYAEITKSINACNSTLLQNINVFDVFESEKLGADKKSYAISLQFLDAEKTLTDIEVEADIKKIIAALEKNTGASIRS
jgi:phenylalanyl-tRNA synthetase beta chain